MNELNQASIKKHLKQAIRPANTELQRDLWPKMLQRLDERTRSKQVQWFDWALLAVLIMCILTFPESIPLLLYHL
jgi:hypothetical protein